MAVWAFDRPVLMRQAAIVAGRLHAVMCAQCLVAPRLILPCVGVEIAEGDRETVAAIAAMGLGRAPTMRSVDPPPMPQSSPHRARRERAPTLRRPDGSDRAGDPVAHRRC